MQVKLSGALVFAIDSNESLDRPLRRSKATAADLLIDAFQQLQRGQLIRTPLDLTKGNRAE
jgi:hypothetical protein